MRTVNTIIGHTAYLTRTERIRTIPAATVPHTARTVHALLTPPNSGGAAGCRGSGHTRLGHFYTSAINPNFDNRAISPIFDRIETMSQLIHVATFNFPGGGPGYFGMKHVPEYREEVTGYEILNSNTGAACDVCGEPITDCK